MTTALITIGIIASITFLFGGTENITWKKFWIFLGIISIIGLSLLIGNKVALGAPANMEYLVVGGGGGSDYGRSGLWYGSPGAGGLTASGTASISAGDYTITVGLGGANRTSVSAGNPGLPGATSSFSTIASASGGYGGQQNGNGASNAVYTGGLHGTVVAGGGASSAENGYASPGTKGGNGGNGMSSSITGTPTYYGGGGSGGSGLGNEGTAGLGGGGTGSSGGYGTSGTANTGGGSGGGAPTGTGGKGIVIIRWLTSDFGECSVTGTGNAITTDGSYSVATFITTGVLTVVEGAGVPATTYIDPPKAIWWMKHY